MEMGGNFCQILELGGTTIKGRRALSKLHIHILNVKCSPNYHIISPSKELKP